MALIDITPTGNLAADVARLMTDLAQVSVEKHNAAVALDHKGETAKGHESQSHAYANVAMWLERLMDAHAAK